MNVPAEMCTRMLSYKPPRIAMTLLVFASLLHFAAPSVWPTLPSSMAGGAALTALGCGIMLRAWWLFRLRNTPVCPTSRATELITHDIYRLTRNPMYLGIVLMLVGIAVATGGALLYAAALVYFLIIDFVFCPYEERRLAQTFPGTFTAYRQDVRRWL